MCSTVNPSEDATAQPADLATQLAAAIDECAAAADGERGAPGPDLTARVATAWAMLAAADPELAARIARYATSET
jgi:hypothetical protein